MTPSQLCVTSSNGFPKILAPELTFGNDNLLEPTKSDLINLEVTSWLEGMISVNFKSKPRSKFSLQREFFLLFCIAWNVDIPAQMQNADLDPSPTQSSSLSI